MPEIEIRPAIASDIPRLVAMDHSYTSDYVWQMEIQHGEEQVIAKFREVHLPRSVRVDYPRAHRRLKEDWTQRSGLLVAVFAGEPVGYVSMLLNITPDTCWVSDLVVKRRLRRQGIGSALLLAAREWGSHHECRNLILEMQTKNYAAIQLVQKMGFDFCGYNDRHFANHDIGLFFTKSLG